MKQRRTRSAAAQPAKIAPPSKPTKMDVYLSPRTLFILLLVSILCFSLVSYFLWYTPSTAKPAVADTKFKRFSNDLVVQIPPPMENDELMKILKHKKDFDTKCRQFSSPMQNLTQRCCEFTSQGKFQCLPNIVILGAQKAGTTALVSYLLLLRDQIDFGGMKELHFFDSDATFQELKSQVSQVFFPKPEAEVPQRVTAESSPSYLADYKACPRMARVLSKDARYIVLLRNPTDRTWSDVQMKKRRMYFQQEFLEEVIPEHYAEIANCIKTCKFQCNYFEFMECLPERVAKHGRLIYLYRWVMSNQPIVHRFTRECLVSQARALKCTTGEFSRKFLDETMPTIPQALLQEAKDLNRTMRCCFDEKQAYRCGSKCFPKPQMMADVTRNHLFRSLYLPQLINCYGSLTRSNVLVLDNQALRDNPHLVLQQVFAHLKLDVPAKRLTEIVSTSEQALSKTLEDRFPDFEAVNGWKKTTKQKELKLSKELRTTLDEFFRPYNKKLFEYLGIEPFSGWAV